MYSADGKRLTSGNSKFVWDGENALLHDDANGNTVLRFTDFPGEWGGLTSLRYLVSNTSLFYAIDMSGDVRMMVDASGTVTDTFDYMAFGDPAGGTQTTNFTWLRYRYKGKYGYYWSQNSVYYVRERWLRTDIYHGAWFSRDPIGFEGGDWNIYRYVGNNPVIAIDPSGLWGKSVHGNCTRQWAREVSVFDEATYQTWGFSEPDPAGDGAASEDDAIRSAVLESNWHVHFNYDSANKFGHLNRDHNRVKNGLSLSSSGHNDPDTRIMYFFEMRQQALIDAIFSQDCSITMFRIGQVLHSIEDMYSHADLTPAEHNHKNQGQYVDNPDWVMFGVPTRNVPLDTTGTGGLSSKLCFCFEN